MSDSDAPRFQVGDIVCSGGYDFEEVVVHGQLAHDDGAPFFIATVILEDHCFPSRVREERVDDVRLIRAAVYLDDEDVKALEIALDVVRVKRGIAPKHNATRRNPLGIPGRDVEERIDTIIARAKRVILVRDGGAAVSEVALTIREVALAMYEFDGSPWVVAESPAAAIAYAKNDAAKAAYFSSPTFTDPRPMRPDEPFTMTYSEEDEIPSGLKRDEFACECQPASPSDCCCEPQVTLTAREWCDRLGPGYVIWEYTG